MELYENMDESVSHLRKTGNKEDKIPYDFNHINPRTPYPIN